MPFPQFSSLGSRQNRVTQASPRSLYTLCCTRSVRAFLPWSVILNFHISTLLLEIVSFKMSPSHLCIRTARESLPAIPYRTPFPVQVDALKLLSTKNDASLHGHVFSGAPDVEIDTCKRKNKGFRKSFTKTTPAALTKTESSNPRFPVSLSDMHLVKSNRGAVFVDYGQNAMCHQHERNL